MILRFFAILSCLFIGLASAIAQSDQAGSAASEPSQADLQQDQDEPGPKSPDQGDNEEEAGSQTDSDPALAEGKPKPIIPGPFIDPGLLNPRNPDLLRQQRTTGSELAAGLPDADMALSGQPLTIGELAPPDPDGVSGLADGEPGLPDGAWRGTPRHRLSALMAQIPVGTASSTVNQLGRKLVLSPIRLEESGGLLTDNDAAVTEIAQGQGLLDARIISLMTAGRVEDVARLLAATPVERHTILIKRALVRSHLALGNYADACDVAREANQQDIAQYWTRALAFCEALAGNQVALDFQVALLEEEGSLDSVFLTLVDAISADRPLNEMALDWGQEMGFDEVDLAMVQLTEAQVPLFRAESASLPIKRALVRSPRQTMALRLALAEDLTRHGLITSEDLAQIFGALTFSAVELGAAEELARASDDLRTDGLLYRMMMEEPDIAARLDMAETLFERAKRRGFMVPVAELLAGSLLSISPHPAQASRAVPVVKMLMLAGETSAASQWVGLLASLDAAQNPDAARSLVITWPLLAIVDSVRGEAPDPDLILSWALAHDKLMHEKAAQAYQNNGAIAAGSDARLAASSIEKAASADLVLSVLEALGANVPEQAWDVALTQSTSTSVTLPSTALWRRMEIAAHEGLVGEGLSAALIILAAGNDPASTPAAALSAALYTLRRLSYGQEAGRLAVEALVGSN